MEQKQLDEIDESYFGEEFIDEETMKTENETNGKKEKKPAKAAAKKTTAKKTAVKTEVKEMPTEEVTITTVKEDVKEETKPEEKPAEEPKKEVPAKAEASAETKAESSPDPWASDEEESGFFAEASTWKAITGIVVILLIFSVFTQGFNFSGKTLTGATAGQGQELSLSEAADKALGYVNDNLLEPPFLATLESSADVGTLYKVTLNVAGQRVDSFLTKDGGYFFPQGFDTSVKLPDTLPDITLPDKMADDDAMMDDEMMKDMADDEMMMDKNESEEAMNDTQAEVVVEVVDAEVEEPVEVVVEESVAVGETMEFSLVAKKWLFSPDTISVKQGDTVILNIQPQGLDFTFALAAFNVRQEVSGPTTVQFTANQAGTFDFTCSSCEPWRGMTGTLVVK